MDTYLNIASFAISIGVLLSQIRAKETARQLIVVVATLLVVTTGAKIAAEWRHRVHIDRVKEDILAQLKKHPRTIDHLRDDLNFEMREIGEALAEGLESGVIKSGMEELTLDGSLIRVRLYSAK